MTERSRAPTTIVLDGLVGTRAMTRASDDTVSGTLLLDDVSSGCASCVGSVVAVSPFGSVVKVLSLAAAAVSVGVRLLVFRVQLLVLLQQWTVLQWLNNSHSGSIHDCNIGPLKGQPAALVTVGAGLKLGKTMNRL